MIENLGYISPETETGGGRRTLLSDSSGKMRRRYVRRKGLGLRRYKSAENLQSDFPEIDRSSKRKRKENGRSLLLEKEESNSAVISLSPVSNEAPASLTKAKIVIPAGRSGAMDDSITAAIEISKDVVRCWSHGSISVIGRRRENEDAVTVELGCLKRGSKGYDFFGVYDGHGGSRVAHDCRDRLHMVLREILEKEKIDDINWNEVMMESFEKIDEEVNGIGAAVATMGSTAVVAVVGEEEVVVANCGDSRAVLSRGGVAVPLSIDHKPDRCDELERIEQCGGKVINWNGQRVLGVLATSRSIGDQYLKPYVISDPEVIVTKRSSRDEFLILASDGLWDVVSNEVACHIVRRCLSGQLKRGVVMNGKKTYHREETGKVDDDDDNNNNVPAPTPAEAVAAAAVLAELAMARGSKDNISVIVVVLRK